MPTSSAPTLRAVALLERAIGYTRTALAGVRPEMLDAPTPCVRWDLRDLLVHMDDSLAAFTEAADLGVVDLRPLARAPEAERLVETLRLRACAALGAWSRHDGDDLVRIGRSGLDPGLLAAAGALEITVHGWDVAETCGLDLPLPDALAERLYDVALDLVGAEDRGVRFAAPRPTDEDDPGERLLAFLGR